MHEVKHCRVCGREMEWRKAWADCWDEVTTCSSKCRKRGLREKDAAIDEALLILLKARGRSKSACPSEVARQLFAEDQWRSEMESVRMAGRRLTNQGLAEFLQKGSPVNPSHAKGPIRIRLKK